MPRRSWRSTARIVASGPWPAIAPVSPRQKSTYSWPSTSREVRAGRRVDEQRVGARPLDHPVHRDAVEQRALGPLEQLPRARVRRSNAAISSAISRSSRERSRVLPLVMSSGLLPGPAGRLHAVAADDGASRGRAGAASRTPDMEAPRAVGGPARGARRGARDGLLARRGPSRSGGRPRGPGGRRPRGRASRRCEEVGCGVGGGGGHAVDRDDRRQGCGTLRLGQGADREDAVGDAALEVERARDRAGRRCCRRWRRRSGRSCRRASSR